MTNEITVIIASQPTEIFIDNLVYLIFHSHCDLLNSLLVQFATKMVAEMATQMIFWVTLLL